MARRQGQGAVAGLGRIREGVWGRSARPIEELGSSSLDVQRGHLAIPLRSRDATEFWVRGTYGI